MKLFSLPLLATSIVAILPTISQAQDNSGSWEIRGRVVRVDTADESSAGESPLSPTLLPSDSIHVEKKTLPEVDVTYFFNKNLGMEWVLAYPTKHDVTIASGPLAEKIGSVKATSTSLALQYHFLPDQTINPYVGAGVNYTRFSSVSLHSNVAGVDLGSSKDSVGGVLQLGADVKIANNLYLNFDIKKIYVKADVKLNGGKVSEVKIDPVVFGAGLGWRF